MILDLPLDNPEEGFTAPKGREHLGWVIKATISNFWMHYECI